MNLFNVFAMDENKEKAGVSIVLSEVINADGTSPVFFIARMGGANKKYEKALETASKPYRRQIDMDVFTNEKADDLMKNIFVGTILTGWKNVFDENEASIEFNRANALELFKRLPELYKSLKEEAVKAANFRMTQMEVEAKN